jgi:hypothetical protein
MTGTFEVLQRKSLGARGGEPKLKGPGEIMGYLKLPWRVIRCLADFEELPLEEDKNGEFHLSLADLEQWQARRQ